MGNYFPHTSSLLIPANPSLFLNPNSLILIPKSRFLNIDSLFLNHQSLILCVTFLDHIHPDSCSSSNQFQRFTKCYPLRPGCANLGLKIPFCCAFVEFSFLLFVNCYIQTLIVLVFTKNENIKVKKINFSHSLKFMGESPVFVGVQRDRI